MRPTGIAALTGDDKTFTYSNSMSPQDTTLAPAGQDDNWDEHPDRISMQRCHIYLFPIQLEGVLVLIWSNIAGVSPAPTVRISSS